MDNGSINPSEVATLSLLGGGVGYGYGGRGYGHEFANDGSNAVRIQASERSSLASHDSLSKQISDNADRNRDISAVARTDSQFISSRDFQTQAQANMSAQIARLQDSNRAEFNAISREMAANAREAAKCCCEAQLLAVKNQAKTDAGLAQILANQACDVRVADAVASATQNAKLDSLLADQHHHRRGNG